ncbi:hypothetical protein PAHAL_3G362700 [Panicum hallii]|jgi:hypothetical protein|uniref:Endonuclease/exonuclease/phosphatase domain-containing protein n=1 Tax=Panicum hallii TaxID=206008 RepID=A0A2T8KKG4_9POAL|nr:hypothetical protein PAHAL_3G362700 [Panicum hallii]
MILGGDFNLIRKESEKSSELYNHTLIAQFNELIGKHLLREVTRVGSKYTWTNKQLAPVLVNLDRFLMTSDWEDRFPLCLAWGLTRVGSDHSPIILDSGVHGASRPRCFFFEKQWLLSLISRPWWLRNGRQANKEDLKGVTLLPTGKGALVL